MAKVDHVAEALLIAIEVLSRLPPATGIQCDLRSMKEMVDRMIPEPAHMALAREIVRRWVDDAGRQRVDA